MTAVFAPLGCTLAASRRDYVKDRYFDDARASLNRAGVALRRRMRSGQMLATLKTRGHVAGAVHEREELELPLPERGWPEPIAERISMYTDISAVRPYTVLDSERTIFPVLDAAGAEVAELSFDLVTASFQHGSLKVEFLEVELEAAAGTGVERLEQLAEALGTIMKLAPSPFTKLERAQALLLGAGS